MTARLASTTAFETYVSHLRENFVINETGGHPVAADKMVDHLRVSLAGNALIDKIMSQYDFENKDASTHSFEDIVKFIEDTLPNLQDAAEVASRTTANVMSSEAYLPL
jgi:hypothetical protein